MNVRHVDDAPPPRSAGRAALSALRQRPWLVVGLVRSGIELAPRHWWRRPPFLPLPDRRYWRFRMETAYGDPDAAPDARDVIEVVRWSRRTRAAHR